MFMPTEGRKKTLGYVWIMCEESGTKILRCSGKIKMHSQIISYSLFWPADSKTRKASGHHYQKDLSDTWAEIPFRHKRYFSVLRCGSLIAPTCWHLHLIDFNHFQEQSPKVFWSMAWTSKWLHLTVPCKSYWFQEDFV